MTTTSRSQHQHRRRERVRLLAAIQTATQALAGRPHRPAGARWLAHRAAAYRQLAAAHRADGAPQRAALADGAAAVDHARAQALRTRPTT